MCVEHIHPFRKWIFVVIPSTLFFLSLLSLSLQRVFLFRGIYIIGSMCVSVVKTFFWIIIQGGRHNWICSYSGAFNRENVIKTNISPPPLFAFFVSFVMFLINCWHHHRLKIFKMQITKEPWRTAAAAWKGSSNYLANKFEDPTAAEVEQPTPAAHEIGQPKYVSCSSSWPTSR